MELDTIALILLSGFTLILIAVNLTTVKHHNAEANRRIKRIMDHLGISDFDGDMSQVETLARHGKKIQAIKMHRQLTGLGLKESKDAVERLAG